ncbi:aminotransferase class I/II-fold pyridoxal phosphate-dependent enzyme [Wenyingzhuangia aestuarii]|uniref:aminotransferase class I/II-fold pyridoxal phosphate-dependent enzyme n=1 Tax=Wenyingzhuangia aestuarii TaxID=1647582 RepID=UPI001438D08A|nr:pyridoxal phosphate-dependent aminotransferase family protein [Wenyingzhuangia aestuarii]NJB81570.1 8-amino-7-oxononanoate synthase [Wenyingzhuangia aestuarii]
MYKLPISLQEKLNHRNQENSFRSLSLFQEGVDFYSNDYLGFSRSKTIAENALSFLEENLGWNGSTGSRLISGTHKLHLEVEEQLAVFHKAEAALLFNSGYDANVGVFSSMLQKGDVLLFDELIHASVRDGIRLSTANTYKFKHNNLSDLEAKLIRWKENANQLYVAIETVYSMDGDKAPLKDIVDLCKKYNAHLIVDEAHSGGVYGANGQGLVCEFGLEADVFVRVHTFGKALGGHGAVVLGSKMLRDYLINFSRSFIYTTAIPLHAVATIKAAYLELGKTNAIEKLRAIISYFKLQIKELQLDDFFIISDSAIHCCVISGNTQVKNVALQIQELGVNVKAVLSPTVPKGKERLRFCLHAFNTKKEVNLVLNTLVKNLKEA